MAKQTKADIRKLFSEKRKALKPAERLRDSAIIRQRLLRHPAWEDAHTVGVYVSFGSEVDTHKIIAETFARRKRIVAPWINPETRQMAFSELRTVDDLAPGFYQRILEPGQRTEVDPLEIEAVLVPGVAFDRKGGRIGMGGGYFDRMLPQMTHAVRIGLAYGAQISKEPLPLEPHDIPLHFIVTESEIIEARSGDGMPLGRLA